MVALLNSWSRINCPRGARRLPRGLLVAAAVATCAVYALLAPSAQAVGLPQNLTLTLSPAAIPADGTSTATAVITVTDTTGNPVPNQNIQLSSTDQGQRFSAVQEHKDAYTATVFSSSTVGTSTITAKDVSATPPLSGQASLTQTAVPTTTSLLATPAGVVTNETTSLVATVTSSSAGDAPVGTVEFTDFGNPIAGCGSVPVTPVAQSVNVTCETSFLAFTSPEQLVAIFMPGPQTSFAPSTSPGQDQSVGRDFTSTSVAASSTGVAPGGTITYTANVASQHPGSTQPTGVVEFFDGGSPIPACSSQPLNNVGGTPTASCTVQYPKTGGHTVTATYQGDGNFAGSNSQPLATTISTIPIGTPPIVSTTMQWSFFYSPSFTRVRSLKVIQAPVGGRLLLACQGRGCTFRTRSLGIAKLKHCPKYAPTCHSWHLHAVDVSALFRQASLRPGARIIVKITYPGWIGKYYSFTARTRQPPRVKIACLPPGASQPAKAC